MITHSELRLGNYVLNYEDIEYITGIHLFGVETNKEINPHLKNLHPVLLTPEILKKCGFKKMEFGQGTPYRYYEYHHEKTSFYLTHESEWDRWFAREDLRHEGTITIKQVKSLHDLQNLFFVLCNDELEINL